MSSWPLPTTRAERRVRVTSVTVAGSTARVGAPVRLRIAVAGEPEPPRESAAKRMSESGIRAARLKGLRERDPALDAAADELDLEIVE